MKTIIVGRLLLIGLAIAVFNRSANAQQSSRLDGNGQVTTNMRTLHQFSAINIKGSLASVEILCGKMPMIEITTDRNIHSAIKASVEDNVLTVRSAAWIEPTKIAIRIHTPSLSQLETDGWTNIAVRNLNSSYLNMTADVGRISLSGKVDNLTLTIKTTQVDASQLATKKLVVNMDGQGKIVYAGNPTRVVKGEDGEVLSLEESLKKTDLINNVVLKLNNNRPETARLLVMGPNEKPFSYGFDIRPFSQKTEQWPIGTKVFLRKDEGKRGSLLLRVEPENAGKVVSLF